MASRQLAAVAAGPDDYLAVYSALLTQCARPAILHWLGAAFDPALAGYWGSTDVPTATKTVLTLIREHSAQIDGIKVSLLDAAHETDAARRAARRGPAVYRRRLPLSGS